MKLTGRQEVLLGYVKDSHGDQVRKYTGEPYWKHPYAVTEILHSHEILDMTEAALCHDLFEDTSVQPHDLLRFLSYSGYTIPESLEIVGLVHELTDEFTADKYSVNRKERKRLESERLGQCSWQAQTIKYADLIDNTRSIVEHDHNFAKVYLAEKRQLLVSMRKGQFNVLEDCEDAYREAIEKLNPNSFV